MAKKQIGFIGLGIMGKPMAKNLMKAGYSLIVYDVNPVPVAEFVVKEGVVKADSSKEVASKSELVITMLPDSPDVEAAIMGKDGVFEGAKPGLIIVDMSSINPLVSQKIEKESRRKVCACLMRR